MEVGIIVATLDLTILPAVILTEIVTLNSFPMAIRISIPNFRSLFRMESITRIATGGSALDLREKELKRLCFAEIPLRFNRSFQEQEKYSMTLISLGILVMFR